jgi:hypothetical protein
MSKKLQLGFGRKKDSSLILDCFCGATVLQPYILYDIPDDLKFSSKELIAAVARNKLYKSNNIGTTAMANPMSLYKAWFKTQKDGKQATIVGYYATKPNTLPTSPGGNSKWCYNMVSLLPRSTWNSRVPYKNKQQTRTRKEAYLRNDRCPLHDIATNPEEKKRSIYVIWCNWSFYYTKQP